MIRQIRNTIGLIPGWTNPLNWHLPWHKKYWDKTYYIRSHFGGFGPFQYQWYSS